MSFFKSTGIAAVKQGRHFLLIDNKYEYCLVAKEGLIKACNMQEIKKIIIKILILSISKPRLMLRKLLFRGIFFYSRNFGDFKFKVNITGFEINTGY